MASWTRRTRHAPVGTGTDLVSLSELTTNRFERAYNKDEGQRFNLWIEQNIPAQNHELRACAADLLNLVHCGKLNFDAAVRRITNGG